MGLEATLTAVQPLGRFGALNIQNNLVKNFQEKPDGDNSWINGGFFVLNKSIFKLIKGDNTSWERDVLPKLAKNSQLSVFQHNGFWHPMDTLRDKITLEEYWRKEKAPWKIW